MARLSASAARHADLAIRLFNRGNLAGRRAFTQAANASGVASLGVEIDDGCMLIGPLTIVGRAGCGYCGAARMRAAAAFGGVTAVRGHRPASVDALAGSVLAEELRAVARRGLPLSELLDHVVAVDLKTSARTVHRVIPLPRCPVCGGAAFRKAAPTDVRLSAATAPWVVVDALAGFLDRRTGVIPAALFDPAGEGGLPLVATTAPPAVFDEDGLLRTLPAGWGKGLTLSGALLSAVGEALERYAASLPDAARIVWRRAEDLGGAYLDPRTLPLYTEAQYEAAGFPCARYDPGVRHPWVKGTWFGTTTEVWVPAVLVYLSLTIQPEHHICQGTSNGLAAAATFEEAALRATLELVERDAMLTAWMAARGGQRLELDATCDRRLRAVLAAVEACGATVELYVLPDSAYGSTVLCLGLGDGRRYPGVTIGLGTGADVRAALRSAVLELGQTGPYLQRMMQSHSIVVPRSRGAVRQMLDHAAYYFPARRAPAFDRLRSAATVVSLGDLPRRRPSRPLAHCAAALARTGIRVAVVDVTSSDLATGPFRVARAVSPDLQPITYGFGLDRVPVARIRRLGISGPIPPIQPVW